MLWLWLSTTVAVTQARKEQLYLSALSLTLARHEFAPLFSSSGGAVRDVSTETIWQECGTNPITTWPSSSTRLKKSISDGPAEVKCKLAHPGLWAGSRPL